MKPLPITSTDEDLLTYVDRWAALLEQEQYEEAFECVDNGRPWTPDLIRTAIKSYGDASPDQKVTLYGKPTDISQRKNVTRWKSPRARGIGEIWYDLNIDGFASDLAAIFWIQSVENGIVLCLEEIHVM